MEKNLLFALDIGTRSIVGMVGEKTEAGIRVLGAIRHEHDPGHAGWTDSRRTGSRQSHPVGQGETGVRIRSAKKQVATAAAGRALSTLNANAELDVHSKGYLTLQEERTLELTAIQAAQKQLATTRVVNDPASYYCVGHHSIVRSALDGTTMKTLVGQRGQKPR